MYPVLFFQTSSCEKLSAIVSDYDCYYDCYRIVEVQTMIVSSNSL